MEDYLRNVKNPRDMEPKLFVKRVNHLENLTLQLPGAPNTLFNNDERKRNFYNAQWKGYRDLFIKAGKLVHQDTFNNIKNYFQAQYKEAERDAKRKQNRTGNGNGGNGNGNRNNNNNNNNNCPNNNNNMENYTKK